MYTVFCPQDSDRNKIWERGSVLHTTGTDSDYDVSNLHPTRVQTEAATTLLFLLPQQDCPQNLRRHFVVAVVVVVVAATATAAVVVLEPSSYVSVTSLKPTQQWGQNLRENFSSFTLHITKFHYRSLPNSHTSLIL